MAIKAKFVHTNIVAKDWKKLARFYEDIFGCIPVPPERNLEGKWLEECTGVPGAQISGIHLRLPGYDDEGPTLEIFQYSQHEDRPETASNRLGFAHIAFEVDDVDSARRTVLDAGGKEVGKLVSLDVPEAGTVTLVYLTDPEGNIIELLSWSK